MATSAGIDTKRAPDAVQIIIDEYQKIKDETSLEKKELDKAKECLKGRLILELEDSRNLAQVFGMSELLENKIRTPEEVVRGIDKVNLEDVNRVANEFFQSNRLNLAIIGPFEDSERFAKLLHC